MAKMLQVRNISNRLHAELVRRARRRGRSLTDFVEDLLEREASRPELEEVLDRLESRQPVRLNRPVAEILEAERARRTR